ncbi:MAG: hypothetical protein BHW00_07665 [Clostridium sp. 26_22]|nr:MAG: hypothetical protein BHW00_07665 [Clostridium sp. 26_22]
MKQEKKQNKKMKTRVILVLLFIALFSVISYISLRGSYLEYKELGENYTEVFFTNLKYKYTIFGINFIALYFIIYMTTRGIKKGLKSFFDKEKKEMPKVPNKSIAFIISAVVSALMSSVIMKQIILCSSNASFGIQDPIYNFDIAYYMFQKPIIQMFLLYFMAILVGLTVYMALYYIIVFNKDFDGVDGKMLKQSSLIKKLIRNAVLIVVLFALMTVLNTTDILTSKMLTIKDGSDSTQNIEITGAGYTEVMIQRWGYLIFAFVMIFSAIRASKGFKEDNTSKVLKNLAIIPVYLVVLFLVIIIFNVVFVNSNKLDKEKEYLAYNIENTKNAYKINIEEKSLENSGTITQKDVDENTDVINNIRIVNEDTVLKTLEDNQTGTGYYSYRNANIAQYKIAGQYKLIYVSPREIKNSGRTYSNKTYEYTHGRGQIVASATDVSETGNLNYIQKDVSGEDDKLGTVNQQIYYGLETNNIVATNTKNRKEYDYTDENNKEYTSSYQGQSGLSLNFIDRVILGIKTGDLNLAFSSEVTNESKILINRNIIKRAKTAMPYLIYDDNPYTVVTDEGKTVWVLDAYTISSQYPYSQFTSIEHDGIKEKINYIRNSVKVIIDSYDGTMKFYVTDKTDPIVMAYRNVYKTLFEDLDTEIPADIAQHFVYPKYLYNVQAKMLKTYHNVKPDVLYRTDDLWDFAKYNSTVISKSTGTILEPYYTTVNNGDGEEVGLVQIYTPSSKQNLISYLVGTTNGSNNVLKLYKFSEDSNILGPMQLDKQLEQDETISLAINALNTTGTKVTKDIVVVPVNNTLLYVESIYQTMLNEEVKVPALKKIVVASGNKVAMGNNLKEALQNLLSKDASNIEVENTDDIDGVIDALVKANKNLSESTSNNDWELVGSDIKKVQGLIDTLEKLKEQEDKKKEALEKENKQSNSINNVVEENIIEENNIVNKTK